MIGVSSFYIKNLDLLEYLSQRFFVEIDILPFDKSYYFSNGKGCSLLKRLEQGRFDFRVNLFQGVLYGIDVSSTMQLSKRIDELAYFADKCSVRGITFGSLSWRKFGSKHVLKTLELAVRRINLPIYFELLAAENRDEKIFGDCLSDLISIRELSVEPLLDTSASGLTIDEIINFSFVNRSYLHISNHYFRPTNTFPAEYQRMVKNGTFLGVSTEMNLIDTFDFER